MKSKLFLAGMSIALTFAIMAIVSCGGGAGDGGGPPIPTSGQLTIHFAERYNGFYVLGCWSDEDEGDQILLAAEKITENGSLSLGRISGGKAVLKVWQSDGTSAFGSYGETTDSPLDFGVIVLSTSGTTLGALMDAMMTEDFSEYALAIEGNGNVPSLNFIDGVGEGDADIQPAVDVTMDIGGEPARAAANGKIEFYIKQFVANEDPPPGESHFERGLFMIAESFGAGSKGAQLAQKNPAWVIPTPAEQEDQNELFFKNDGWYNVTSKSSYTVYNDANAATYSTTQLVISGVRINDGANLLGSDVNISFYNEPLPFYTAENVIAWDPLIVTQNTSKINVTLTVDSNELLADESTLKTDWWKAIGLTTVPNK